MSRKVVNKPVLKSCDICHNSISLYSFASHLKWSHKMSSEEYVKLYGEFRKIKSGVSKRNITKLECKICNGTYSSVGFFVHLRDSHGMNPNEYANKHGEYRPSILKQSEYKNRLLTTKPVDIQRCEICNESFASGHLLGAHIKKAHGMDKNKYVLEYIFKKIHPTCKCGCGKKVKLLYYKPYKTDYISGHNSIGVSNPMYGKIHTKLQTDSK